MSAIVMERVEPTVALRTADEAIDQLLAADFTGSSDDELLETFRRLERLRRRLAAVDSALILEAEARQLPDKLSVRHVGGMLRALLRLDPREAAGRVRAAEAAGSRRALTGETLAPAYPLVAQAQAAGEISGRHAAVITTTIEKLPDAARSEQGAEIERTLVRYAGQFDPDNLAKIARRIRYWYDQDGDEPDDGHRQRTRDFRIVQRPDGSAYGEFEATAELAELLLTHFDALAGPKPDADGVKDPRTAGQRRHDALLESLKLAVRARTLPSINGVTATIVVTMTKEQYETGRGLARTGHGALVPAKEAIRWGGGGGELRLLAVVLSWIRQVEAYSTAARLFNETQRLVLDAVHGGCTFPNCPAPAGRCQIHHLEEWAAGGPTCVHNAPRSARTTITNASPKAGPRSRSRDASRGCRRPGSTPTRNRSTTTSTCSGFRASRTTTDDGISGGSRECSCRCRRRGVPNRAMRCQTHFHVCSLAIRSNAGGELPRFTPWILTSSSETAGRTPSGRCSSARWRSSGPTSAPSG